MKIYEWIKQHFSRHAIQTTPQLSGVRKYLQDPALWSFNRDSVAKGVALGLFSGLIPVMPFQMLFGAVLAIMLRANLPVTIAFSWINNPITLVPIVYFASAIGRWILGDAQSEAQLIIHKFAWKLGLTHESLFTSWVGQFGKDFFVGLPILAVMTAIVGYLLVMLVWYVYGFFKKKS